MRASDLDIDTQVKLDGKRGTVIGNKLSGDNMVAIEWEDGTLTKECATDLSVVDSALETV